MSAPWAATADAVATGTAVKTILQVAAAAQERLVIDELSITFDGTTATATPVLVQLVAQSTAGTGGTTVTPTEPDQASGTATVTALKGPAGTWTAEPTTGDVLREWRVPPTSGLVLQFPLGKQPRSAVGGRLAIRVTAAATVNATAALAGLCD